MRDLISMRPVLLLVVCLCLASLGACKRTPATMAVGGPTMGTSYSVRIVQAAGLPEQSAVQAAVDARLDQLNSLFSTYLPGSELSRFNSLQSTDWFAVSPAMVQVVEAGRQVHLRSNGAFDVTVGPLVDLWGFGPAGQPRRVPGQDEIERRLETTGYQLLETRAEPPAMRKQHVGVEVDLSAIAKGYAVDEVARLLDQLGARDYMVEIGGEVRTRGLRADGNAWRIALESPVAGSREILRIIPLGDMAMATSGDYRNFFELDGVRYSHTIDPRSGWPVAHELTAASVIAPDCMTADAWATAMLVLGAGPGMAVAQAGDLAVNLLVLEGDGFAQRESDAYARATVDAWTPGS